MGFIYGGGPTYLLVHGAPWIWCGSFKVEAGDGGLYGPRSVVEHLLREQWLHVTVAYSIHLSLHYVSSFVCFWDVFTVPHHFLFRGTVPFMKNAIIPYSHIYQLL
jgi:hypothetical protein